MSGLLRLSRSEAVIAALLAAAMMATPEADAGDAVVIGYNADGIWTSVTYYCSGTPKGGADYKDEAGAREAAVADLKKRAGEGVGDNEGARSVGSDGALRLRAGEKSRG